MTAGSDKWSDEETDNTVEADLRNFYKVEKWTKDGTKVDRMLYAGNNLKKARELFQQAINYWPRIRLTIRQRTRVLQQWPATDSEP
jgi:hypothetical protein